MTDLYEPTLFNRNARPLHTSGSNPKPGSARRSWDG